MLKDLWNKLKIGNSYLSFPYTWSSTTGKIYVGSVKDNSVFGERGWGKGLVLCESYFRCHVYTAQQGVRRGHSMDPETSPLMGT